jgi:hypothetical protein
MNLDDATELLAFHAGLHQSSKRNVPSLFDALDSNVQVEESTEDALGILNELNILFNGEIPSESTTSINEFPRRLVYAVSELIGFAHKTATHNKDPKAAEQAARAALRIEIAWSAVLAGDIDDLLDHVAGEEPYN